ncbi:MAG TPA: hypothetical protein PLI51_10965 [bacterium]|mgnify:CR=1 FL=1|nr:hypothetical protein [bacterium]HPQ67238.1 hypothetical protein [bacterium]
MITFFIAPFVLCFLLYLFARRNADYNIVTSIYVALGAGLGCFVISHAFADALGFFVVIPMVALSGFLIWKFCYTTVAQTVIVTIGFMGYVVFFPKLIELFLNA